MAKKVTGSVKLQIPAGKATPAPPVGTALGPQGVNIMEFCKQFNAKTSGKENEGLIIPVVITIYSDRTFTFITKTPPVPILVLRAAGIAKGSATPNRSKVGKISAKQVVGVGDAENDHVFLEACGVAAAVDNALAALKERCDLVLPEDHGRGVTQLIERILQDDLASLGPRRPRAKIVAHQVTKG